MSILSVTCLPSKKARSAPSFCALADDTPTRTRLAARQTEATIGREVITMARSLHYGGTTAGFLVLWDRMIQMELLLIANDAATARAAENAGIDRIFVDLERR